MFDLIKLSPSLLVHSLHICYYRHQIFKLVKCKAFVDCVWNRKNSFKNNSSLHVWLGCIKDYTAAILHEDPVCERHCTNAEPVLCECATLITNH